MFIEMLGIKTIGFLGWLLSTLGIFAIGFAKDDDDDEEKVIFKNQEAFNDVLEGRLAKQKKKFLDEWEPKLKDLKEDFEGQISSLKSDLKDAKKTKSKDGDDDNPKLAELTKSVEGLNKQIEKITKERDAAVTNAEKITATNREKTIQSTIVSLLSDAKVTAPNDIYLILKESGNIALNEKGNVIPVYKDTENQVHGSDGEMDIKSFIDGWVKEHPHFVSASGNTGSGTKPANTSKKPGEINDGDKDDKPPTLSDILLSKDHKDKERELREDGGLEHGGADIE